MRRLQRGLSGVLLAPDQLDSSGISSSAAVGSACLLALEHANGLELTICQNVELDRWVAGHLGCILPKVVNSKTRAKQHRPTHLTLLLLGSSRMIILG